jgi:hypothetical protein
MNGGFDRDLDLAVQYAHGEYCWLVPDDDLLIPGAIDHVLMALRTCNHSLIIGNIEVKDVSMSTTLVQNFLGIEEDCVFHPDEAERLFLKFHCPVTYLGCVIIKRSVWLKREREKYYGSGFVHLGVIFQCALPGSTLVMARQLIANRHGNAQWISMAFEIFVIQWPVLIASFALPEHVKRAAYVGAWVTFGRLLWGRTRGKYSLNVYRKSCRPQLRSIWQRLLYVSIAMLPPFAAHTLGVAHGRLSRLMGREDMPCFQLLTQSRANASESLSA